MSSADTFSLSIYQFTYRCMKMLCVLFKHADWTAMKLTHRQGVILITFCLWELSMNYRWTPPLLFVLAVSIPQFSCPKEHVHTLRCVVVPGRKELNGEEMAQREAEEYKSLLCCFRPMPCEYFKAESVWWFQSPRLYSEESQKPQP